MGWRFEICGKQLQGFETTSAVVNFEDNTLKPSMQRSQPIRFDDPDAKDRVQERLSASTTKAVSLRADGEKHLVLSCDGESVGITLDPAGSLAPL